MVPPSTVSWLAVATDVTGNQRAAGLFGVAINGFDGAGKGL